MQQSGICELVKRNAGECEIGSWQLDDVQLLPLSETRSELAHSLAAKLEIFFMDRPKFKLREC